MRKKIKSKINIFLVAVFILTASFLSVACNKVTYDISIFNNTIYSHLVMKQENQTVENFRLNYSNVVWDTQQDEEDFISNIELFFNSYSTNLNNYFVEIFKNAPESLKKLVPSVFTEVKNENSNIILAVSFPDKAIWAQATIKEGLVLPNNIEKDLFTLTRIDRLEKIGSVVRIDESDVYYTDYFSNALKNHLQENFPIVLESSEIKEVYAYATSVRRQHTNADKIALVQGMYFHQWDLTEEGRQIEFYRTYARVESWYITALAVALLTISIVIFASLFSKKDKNKKNKVKNEQDEKEKTSIKEQRIKTEIKD